MKLPALFGRRRLADEDEDEDRIRAAGEVLRRFREAVDRAVQQSHRSDSPFDEGFATLVVHRMNWLTRCALNLEAARAASKRGDRVAFNDLVERAVSRAERGIADLERSRRIDGGQMRSG